MNLTTIYIENYNAFFIKSFGRVYDTVLNSYSKLVLSKNQELILKDNSKLKLLLSDRQTGKTSLLLFELIANASKQTCSSTVLCNGQTYATMLAALTRDLLQDFGDISCVQTKYNTIVLHNGSTIVFANIDCHPQAFMRRYDYVYIDEALIPKVSYIETIINNYVSSGASILAVGTGNNPEKISIFDNNGFSIHYSSMENQTYPSDLRNVVLDMYEF